MAIFEYSLRGATYSCPCFIASRAIYTLPQLPSVIVAQSSNDCLGYLRRSYQEIGSVVGRKSQDPSEICSDPVHKGEYRWVNSRPEVVLPFLRQCQLLSLIASNCPHPGNPCPAICSESNVPCGLQRLKVLIRLEEGPDAQRVQYSECDQK